MIILGVDPSFVAAGYGIIEVIDDHILLLHYGVITQKSKYPLPDRLSVFHDGIKKLIIDYKVTDLAIETPFFGKNMNTFVKLGYLRGILLMLHVKHGLKLHEYAPREVKRMIVGAGNAEKEQVADKIKRKFPCLQGEPITYDATDALAVALCAANV